MKVTKINPSERFNRNHRKEKHFYESYTLVTYKRGEGFKELIDLRLYATQARHYAAVWVRQPEDFRSGTGWAGGYGYNRMSAAAADAFRNAGYEFDHGISGRGETAVHAAMWAIARSLGYTDKQFTIINGHG